MPDARGHGLGDDELSRLRGAIDAIDEGFQIIGFDWRYLYVNNAVCRHGQRARENLLGHTMMECYPGIDQTEMFRRLVRCMSDRRPSTMENEFSYPGGRTAWFELRIQPCPEGISVLSVDVTQRKKLEAHLQQTQKMEAVGRLAGGVAHDFNNLLSVILSYSALALREMPLDSPLRDDLEEIKKAGQRAAELTRQLLAFSRKQIIEPRIVDLNSVITNMDKMIRRLVGEDIAIKTVPHRDLGRVKVDPGQMEQVIMNLVVNARDAMPSGGALTIETGNVDLDEAYAQEHAGAAVGPHVMLAVSDTGTGMDRATQDRIFEPFFTTKEKGHGTGLGLSTVYGIVKQAGGNIWIYSEVGKGTTFKVYLPRTDETAEQLARRVEVAIVRGTETILLAEDDEQVRALASTILRKNGYVVLEARNGTDALALVSQAKGPIHLVLTDVVMPEMSGRELADRLAAIRPGVKVLYMSGYTEDAVVHHRVLEAGIVLLQKPITPDALLRKVREVLDASS